MIKWLVLAAGAFLFFNGMMSRTFDYVSPARYCWVMDYVRLNGCFASPAGPQVVVWGTALLGAALIAGCVWFGRRQGG
jgi:hypothetical protein